MNDSKYQEYKRKADRLDAILALLEHGHRSVSTLPLSGTKEARFVKLEAPGELGGIAFTVELKDR